MVLKVFYREENEAELKEILEEKHIDKNGMPLDRSCDLLMKKTDLERSQYKMVKSEACYDFLLGTPYPRAAEIAKIQGGDLTLTLEEEKHTGKLEYSGNFLISTCGDTLLTDFLISAMTMADQYTFEGKDSLVHLEFFFESCNLTKMKDYSKEIETLRQKICQLNQD